MYTFVLSAAYHQSMNNANPQHENYHRLLYVTDGQVRVTVGDRVYIAEKDTFIILNRFEQCDIEVIEKPYRLYKVCVSSTVPALENYSQLSILFNRNIWFSHVLPAKQHSAYFRSAFAQMIQVSPQKQTDMLLQILSTLQTLVPRAFADITQDGCKIVWHIQNLFENDFQQKYSLAQLADEFHLSAYYLSHLFKRITGYSLMGYLRSRRIAAAKWYLTQTEISIEEIVTKCGFSDSNNFGRIFKTETDLSPSSFRKLNTH